MNTPAQPGGIVANRPDLTEVALDGPLKNMAQAWSIAQVLAQSSMVPNALRGSPQNPCSGDTRYWTRDGLRTLRETAGTTQEILTAGGAWAKAAIRSFGTQPLWAVTLRRGKQEKIIRATADHGWFLDGRKWHRPDQRVTTAELRPGNHLAWQLPKPRIRAGMIPSPFGAAHGITFGDGGRTQWAATVCLFGAKAELARYFPESQHRPLSETYRARGLAGVEATGLPLFFKDRPPLEESASYLYGWLAGYFAADGCVAENGTATLSSSSQEILEFTQLVATRLGIGTYGTRETPKRGYKPDGSMMYTMTFIRSTLHPEFFLRAKHRDRFERHQPAADRIGWTVVSVEPAGQSEEVFCAVVPGHGRFVLEDWIVSSNCLVTMMLGQELGLTWTQATRGIYVLPNGTPGLRGQLLLALIHKAGHRYTFERTENSCKCTITRKDEDFKVPYEGTFTLDDALAAGLVSKKDGKLFARSSSGNPLPWEQYRRDMLQWRSVARAAGVGAPEVIYGFDIAGIGDSAENVAGAAPAGPAPPQPEAATWQAEPVENVKDKLAGLDQQAQASLPEPDDEPFPEDHGVAAEPVQDAPAQPERQHAAPPGYDDLDALLRRCGFHGPAQADLVSALVHRDVSGLPELSKGEVLIAHDVITRAVKNATTVGARRAALAQLAAAERDVMQSQDEGSTWLSRD